MSFIRRDALRWAGHATMASTFLPLSGRHRVWSHPSDNKLLTRPFGRTGREVTTFGLAGGNKVMWELPNQEAVQIVVKAVRAGITYLETANAYQLSQTNYGKAFRILNLVPGQPGYDAALRGRLFIASKTRLRTGLVRGDAKPTGVGAITPNGNRFVVDELRRTLTQLFGDGQGSIPEGAYVDLMQIHALSNEADVDTAFEGMENPEERSLPRIGVLATLIDYRDGSNRTGLNPDHRKWVRHIGITGHENPMAHMYAMRRDTGNNLETLLVALNPNDIHCFSHQFNSIPVAAAKGMGVIGMKVFADGVFYGLQPKYAGQPGQSVLSVGKPGKPPSKDFIHYTLSTPGVSTLITGIGLIDPNNDPSRDQVVANLAAAQLTEPMTADRRKRIEEATAAQIGTDTNFFQRPSSGLLPPQSVTLQRPGNQGPMTVQWTTAYAGSAGLVRYEIFRFDQKVGDVPYAPQTSETPFSFIDKTAPDSLPGGLWYRVRIVDAAGRSADSLSVKPA
jgi:aryl-alcohol dehydrogenase-like predicted oxidoreductase